MKSNIFNLQGAVILSKQDLKNIIGGKMALGTCGYKVGDNWVAADDWDGDGATKDDAIRTASALGSNWCCDSCPWN